MRQLSLCAGLLLAYCCCQAQGTPLQKTTAYYNTVLQKDDLAKLSFFFSQMPKGADLHHHYSGSVYAESYLDWAKERNYHVSGKTYQLIKPELISMDSLEKNAELLKTFRLQPNAEKNLDSAKKNDLLINSKTFLPDKFTRKESMTIDALRNNGSLYRNLLSTWSTLDYCNHITDQVPPDQHFFNTFGYFGSISKNFKEGFAELKNRAVQENIQYIETMLAAVNVGITSTTYNVRLYEHLKIKKEEGLASLFGELKNSLNESSLNDSVNSYVKRLKDARAGIDDENFTMRFQAYATRNNDPSTVFISVYAAFKACVADPDIVALNFVGPENGVVAMNDYWLHMQMFSYFKSLPEFKNVHLALHAGELAPGLVKPEDLGYHIYEALTIAGAERIGHGVDLPYEQQSMAILNYMAKYKTAIEINLTSNEFILGVKNNRHPIHLYYDAKVPVIISSDDAGVSRNTLTEQYVMLAERYHFTYAQIREFVLNSITYSFLPEALKEKNKELLNRRFTDFEKKIAAFAN